MLTLTIASLRRHGRRYVAAAVAVVLGVGFLAATLAITSAAKKGVGDALVAQYSKADVIVRAASTDVRPSDVGTVTRLTSVAAATVSDQAWYAATWPGADETSQVEVGEIAGPESLRWQRLHSGRFPEGQNEIVLDADLASEHGLQPGDRVDLAAGTRPTRFDIVGLTEPVKGVRFGPVMYVQDRPSLGWGIDRAAPELLLGARDGASPDQLAADVRGLGLDVHVMTTDDAREQVTSSMTNDVDLIGLMLTAFAAVAMFVAALVIANTFAIVVAQRSRDLALLRCVGGSRRQVLGSVVGESIVLGLVTAVIGTAVGIGSAALLIVILNETALPVPMSLVRPSTAQVLIPVLAGFVVTVLAGIGPALRARRMSPLAALRPELGVPVRTRAGALRLAIGAALSLIGLSGLFAGMQASSLRIGIAAGAIGFVGVLVLSPFFVPSLIRAVGAVRRLLPHAVGGGVPANLAVANAVRNPRRTAATTSALLVGVTLISMLTVGAASLSASATRAIDRNHPVDLTVSAPNGLSASTIDQVGSVDGVESAVELRGFQAEVSAEPVQVAALHAADLGVIRDAELRATVESGTALVPANRFDLLPSGSGRLEVHAGGAVVTVPATMTSIDAGPVVIPEADLERLGTDRRAWGLWLRIDDDADPQSVTNAIDDAIASSPEADQGVEVQGGYVERSGLDQALDVMLMISTGLLALAVVIALFGVSNTLSLSVVERIRENALLRALGLTRTQQRLMLAAEAALMALVATVVGVLLGIGFGWAATVTVIGKVSSHPALLDVPWQRLTLVAVVAVSAGLAASILPGRRAARTPPASVLT